MNYFHSKTITGKTMEQVREAVTAALHTEGFGVLTEIDIKATMKKKLDKDYLPHVILGACNPVYADKVLSVDPHISTMLPCNVTLRDTGNGDIEVAAIDPVAAMGAVENENLTSYATEVSQKLQRVLAAL